MARILVLSPHPDDESIGCGGTLRKHVEDGDQVRVIFLTSGEKGGHGRSPSETVRVREEEARQAAKILGIQHLEFWHQPDGAIAATEAVAGRLRAEVNSFSPDVIYVTHEREMHPDHRASVRLLRRALRGGDFSPCVLAFEVWTPLQKFHKVVDISSQMNVKIQALEAYQSQCEVVEFVAAVRGLNRYRGEMHSWPGGDYAEVFARLKL